MTSEQSIPPLGQRIKQARKDAGLTQQDLASKAGISYSTMAKLEQGSIEHPSATTLVKLAKAMGTDVGHLLGTSPSSPAQSMGAGGTPSPVPTPLSPSASASFKFVYFDIGRVLVHVDPALQAFSVRVGKSLDQVRSLFYSYAPLSFRGKLSEYDLQLLFMLKLHLHYTDSDREKLFRSWADDMTPIKPTHEFLVEVSRHYPVGLITNTITGYVARFQHLGIIPEIDYKTIIASCDEGVIKPEPEIYEIATEQAGVEPEDILFIDDSMANIEAAKEYGWQVAWFDELHPQDSIDRIRREFFG